VKCEASEVPAPQVQKKIKKAKHERKKTGGYAKKI
jgi:hypothetical protein